MLLESEQSEEEHFARLRDGYSRVGDSTWSASDFLQSNLEASRNLFTPESLVERRPCPKALEVFALLSGVSFDIEFTDKLVEVQDRITDVLGERLHYWVAPANFGVEYCVFKWPTDSWSEERLGPIRNVLTSIRQPSYQLSIGGVQINPDGCVIARGYDEGGALFRIREQLKADVPLLPAKQSGWAHVPLGRILEPLGIVKFDKLAHLMSELSNVTIATTGINSMKLIHETRWYMEEKAILTEYSLSNGFKGPRS